MPRRCVLALLPLVAACESPTGVLPPGAEAFQPPAVYEQWWSLTEGCSGVSGDYAQVRWYRVPNTDTIPLGDGTEVNGLYEPSGNRIVLGGDDVEAGDLVRHEMLHALLKVTGHPRAMFIGRCQGIVVCTGRCITDGGPAPAPDPAAKFVEPSALQVGVEVTPAAPSSQVDGGYFMMFVTARNTAPVPVIVQLHPSGDAGPPISFSFAIAGLSEETFYDMRAEVPEVARFEPLETKRFLFDLHVGAGPTRYDQSPGTFRFGGGYNGVGAPNPPVVTVR